MFVTGRILGALSVAGVLVLGPVGALAQSAPQGAQTAPQGERETGRAEEPGEMRHDRRGRHFIRIFDTDGDGTVSIGEIEAEQKRILAAADVDGNGALSVDEFRRRGRLIQSLGTTTLFDLLDTNGDQKITADELTKPSARWFSRYDENGDGAMAADELPQHHKHRRGGHGGRR